MSREIKFRAWVEYEDRDKFIYPSRITFMPTIIYVYDSELDYEHQIEPKYLQQWTGLLDKNGKEIYEGDILEGGGGNIIRIGVIKYDMSAYWFAIDGWDVSGGGLAWHIGPPAKIIGNIWQNPELLDGSWEAPE